MTDRQVPWNGANGWSNTGRWLLIGATILVLTSCQSNQPLVPPAGGTPELQSELAPILPSPPPVQAAGGAVANVSDLPAPVGPASLARVWGPWPCAVSDACPTPCLPTGLGVSPPMDEYICDGGDGEVMASVGADLRVHGLEPEDTVLHYDTLDGRTVVEPSNRVCIYGPRFAAVRKVTGILENERLQRSWRLYGETGPVDVDDLQIPTDVNQPIGTVRQVGTKLTNELDDFSRGVGLDGALRLVQERDGRVPHEDATVTVQDVVEDMDEPQTAATAQQALVWALVQAVQMVIDGQQAMVEATYQSPNVIYQYKLAGKPRMRVIKSASTDMARPGDVIDFTIRLDNVGTQRVDNLTIVDNLTPRLEYVPDTAQCSLDAAFSAEPNEVDSLLLRWDIREPIPPGEGGVIRFHCRVR